MAQTSRKYSLKALGSSSVLLLAIGIYGSVWGVEANPGQQQSKVSRGFQFTGLLKPLLRKRTKTSEAPQPSSPESKDGRSPETLKARDGTAASMRNAERFLWVQPSEVTAPDDQSNSNRIQRLPPVITPPVPTSSQPAKQEPSKEPPSPQTGAESFWSRHLNPWQADSTRHVRSTPASSRRQWFQEDAAGGNQAPTEESAADALVGSQKQSVTSTRPETNGRQSDRRNPLSRKVSPSRKPADSRLRANWFEELVTGPGSTGQVRPAEIGSTSATRVNTLPHATAPNSKVQIAAARDSAFANDATASTEHDRSGFKRLTESTSKFQAPANPIPTIRDLPSTTWERGPNPLLTKGGTGGDTNWVVGRDTQRFSGSASSSIAENQVETTRALTVDYAGPRLQGGRIADALVPNSSSAIPLTGENQGLDHGQPADQEATSMTRLAQGAGDVPHYSEPIGGQFDRSKVIFRPAVPGIDHAGRKILRPSVELADLEDAVVSPIPYTPLLSDQSTEFMPDSSFPEFADDTFVAATQPNWGPPRARPAHHRHHRIHRRGGRILGWLNVQSAGDIGIGRERLDNAPFEIDTTQPMNNFRVRFDAAYNQEFPDRAEYFWAKTPMGKGPMGTVGEPEVDYQDFRFLMESGGKKFSVGTEIPLRVVDPLVRGTSAGLGDMSLTTKTMLLDGDRWQLTQIFRSHFNTGSPSRGLGNGHVSLEPGLLARYKWTDITYLHSQVKYWFPLGGDPIHSGQVLNYGLGISHLWFDADNFAIIPTLEFVGWTVLDGQQSPPVAGMPQEIDGFGIFNVHPGVRFVCDKGGDLGLFELGISTGFAASRDHWYESLLRVDLRWSY